MTTIDPGLIQFATVRELEVIEAIEQAGSMRKAAASLGVAYNAVHGAVERLKKRAALTRGYAPEHDLIHPTAPGFPAKGHTTLYRMPLPEGEAGAMLQWVKTDRDAQAYAEAVQGAISAFVADVEPIVPGPGPVDFQNDIIPWIQIGDAHIGMLAHAAEVGENFDLKIAERELCKAIAMIIDDLPPCERIVVNDLGDATHYDNFSGTTAASGHVLDYDSRFPRMIRVYSRVMRFIVDRCLTRAKFVDVIINQGNHSRVNDFWMRELLTVGYGHTGRVKVLDNDSVFIGYRMGNTLVMVHHSDKCPPARLVGVMTSDLREDFGETEHHYIDMGHVHHHFVSKEYPSVIIESWNHLAPNDKWANDAGYRSRKSISVVYRSRTYGDMGRRVLPIQQVRDAIAKANGAAAAVKTRPATYTV